MRVEVTARLRSQVRVRVRVRSPRSSPVSWSRASAFSEPGSTLSTRTWWG